jgi:hypothetical protein
LSVLIDFTVATGRQLSASVVGAARVRLQGSFHI